MKLELSRSAVVRVGIKTGVRFGGLLKYMGSSSSLRRFLRRITEKCPVCGRSILQSSVLLRSGVSVSLCSRCKTRLHLLWAFQSFLERLMGMSFREFFTSFRMGRGIKRLHPIGFSNAINSVMRGIGLFGLRRPITSGAPLTFFWEITNLCNLNCVYCYARDKKFNELTTEECFRVIDELSDAGVVSVTLSGGEPLMRKDFFDIANYASKKGLMVFLATNGTLITRRVARKLKEAGVVYVEISIDSPRKEVHEALRGKGTFEKAVRGVKNCIKEGVPTVAMATTLNSHNKSIEEIFEFAKSIGVHQIVFLNYVPTRRASGDISLDLHPREREEIIKKIMREQKKYDCFKRVTILQATYIFRIADKEGFPKRIGFWDIDKPEMVRLYDFIGGCGAGRFMLAMLPNGDITPCPLLPLKLGNIRENRLLDVWINSPILNDLRDRRNWKGRCRECKYNIVCGGSRCRAYAYFNDYLAPDPGCLLNEDIFNSVLESVKLASVETS